jgi:16S rRNA (guanine(527)-N(7))-methyltransferase RsmG
VSEEARFVAEVRRWTGPFLRLSAAQGSLLYKHFELLRRWNKVLNLTRVDTIAEAAKRHYAESLWLAAQLSETVASVADIGAGAGFPGVPVAVVRPSCRVVLVESHQRKAAFLREAVSELPNVQVEPRRAETLAGPFDCVVSRAVRPLDVMEIARRLSARAALLVGLADAQALAMLPGMAGSQVQPLPWGKESAVFLAPTSST